MSIELVTGRAGKPHVSSDDVAGLLRAAMGAGSYVLGATLPKISMSNANTCAISPAELLLSGRHVKLTGTNSVTVESGGQATYRIDYICVRYKRDISLGIESAELVEIKGEPAASKDEAVAPNIPLAPEINATSQQVDVPIIRIDVDRLTPACTWVIPTVSSLSALAGLRDSVSRTGVRTVLKSEWGQLDVWSFGPVVCFFFTWTSSEQPWQHEVVATLPLGMRPLRIVDFPMYRNGDGAIGAVSVQMYPDGTVHVVGHGGAVHQGDYMATSGCWVAA